MGSYGMKEQEGNGWLNVGVGEGFGLTMGNLMGRCWARLGNAAPS